MIGAKYEKAYQDAQKVLEQAYQQGLAAQPMHGDALKAADFIEEQTWTTHNSFYLAYQRGWNDRKSK